MKIFFLILLSCCFQLFAYPNFEDNPLLDDTMRKMMVSHLIPINHPMKKKIDLIFSRSDVVKNQESIRRAGFSIMYIQPRTNIVIARHPSVPGYIFKMYRESKPNGRHNLIGWKSLVARCHNSKKIREIIDKNGLCYFTVPTEWLYILPRPSPLIHRNHQSVVLIATDMEIEDTETTLMRWKTVPTREHLNQLYCLYKAGYGSTSLHVNIPSTKHNQFAIVDTEDSKRKVKMHNAEQYFSENMKHYWRYLIQ